MFDGLWAGILDLFTRKAKDGETFRQIAGLLEAWVSIIGNILLFAAKFVIGTLIGSISLIADSFHTLSDVLTSVVVLVGFKISGRAPDKEHPFGHGRGESVATLIIAMLLLLVSVEFMVQSIKRLFHPTPVGGTVFVVAVMVFSGAIKELMASLSIKSIGWTAFSAWASRYGRSYRPARLSLISILAVRFGVSRKEAIRERKIRSWGCHIKNSSRSPLNWQGSISPPTRASRWTGGSIP